MAEDNQDGIPSTPAVEESVEVENDKLGDKEDVSLLVPVKKEKPPFLQRWAHGVHRISHYVGEKLAIIVS